MKGLTWRHAALTLGAFIVLAAAFQAAGVAGGDVAGNLARTLSSGGGWRDILAKATPLILAGLGVFIALRAGLFNIGAEGQMLMGGLAAGAILLAIPNALGIVLALLAGALAGAMWALPAGWIRAYRGGHEVISTIMLNWMAKYFCDWVAKGPMKDPNQQSATSADIAPSAMMPVLVKAGAFEVNLAFVSGAVLLAGSAYWLSRSTGGFELEATGAGPEAALTAGVPVKHVLVKAMLGSGALSGLAGAFLVSALDHRFYSDLSGGYGFDALGVALLAGGSPWALLPSAFFFSVVDVATSRLSLIGIPKGISGLLLGLVILVFAATRFRRRPVS
jgi:simple sugar transport system permease protein